MIEKQQDIDTRQFDSLDRANQANHNLIIVDYDLDAVLDGNQLQLLVHVVSGQISVRQTRIERVDRKCNLEGV